MITELLVLITETSPQLLFRLKNQKSTCHPRRWCRAFAHNATVAYLLVSENAVGVQFAAEFRFFASGFPQLL